MKPKLKYSLIILTFLVILVNLGYSQTTVPYAQRTSHYTSFSDGGGTWDNGADEVGMWANFNAKQVVNWRKFKTAGDNTGSDRALQAGDKFTLTVSATRAYGKIGCALLASPSTGSWANRESNYAISVNLDGPAYTGSDWGLWYIKYNGGATSAASFGGVQGSYYNYTFEFTLTAVDRMNVVISDNNGHSSAFYDILLNTTAPITDYSIFLQDDWNGGSNSNIYWKPVTSVTNTGILSIGESNGNITPGAALTDGLDAASTTVVSVNSLVKKGTGTLTLSTAGVFTGSTTINNGTLELSANLASSVVTVQNGGILSIPGSVTLSSLTIDNGGITQIPSTGSLTISGAFANNSSSAGMTVESGGSLITSGSVSGPASLKREIPSDNKWHFLSSPVAGQNICDGSFAPVAGSFNSTTGVTYDFYRWSEATVSGNLNWLNLKNSDWSLNTTDFGATPQFGVTTGYLVAYDPAFAGSTTKIFAGTLTSGDQAVSLGTSGNTWNLIGNPFSSAIDWDMVTKTSLDGGYYYVYNEDKAGGSGYESYLDASHKTSGANGKISLSQGFFVKASGSSLLLPNNARVHNNNWMKGSETMVSNLLKITLSNGSNFDETQAVFEESGSAGRDFYDADKLMSLDAAIPQVYSKSEDGFNLSINSMPFNVMGFSLPLGSQIPADGEYTLSISGIESFPMTPTVMLEDLKTSTFHDIILSPEYDFQAESNEDPNRFILHFAGVTSMSDPLKAVNFIAIPKDGYIVVKGFGLASGDITVSDLGGRMLNSGKLVPGADLTLNMFSCKGIYLISLKSEAGISTQKVLLR